MTRKTELIFVPLAEAGLLFAIGGIGVWLGLPLLFGSLGPTAYEQIEKPETKSARPYNVLAGHGIALACGFFALWVLGGFHEPLAASSGHLSATRLLAGVLACVLIALLSLLAKATQPAAFATGLLVTLGGYQSGRAALSIVIAVLLLTALGEPLRRKSLQMREQKAGIRNQPL
ncbi:MAG TPA: HPP family protein [Candidatus Angelobacter sp.]|nr:HPP family protein [Candidatus Angelobacter sp.]